MIIYFDMMKSLSTLQPEEFKTLIIAMGDYAMNGLKPDFPKGSISNSLWPMLEERLDRDEAQYQEKKRKNSQNRRYGAYRAARTKAGLDCMSIDEWREQDDAGLEP